MNRYEYAKAQYAAIGVDTEQAIEKLLKLPIAMHCWQGDDVTGFDHDGPLSGGIQATGNYPGKATTPEQLMADLDKAFSLIPGKHKLNLHACYAVFQNGYHDRDQIQPEDQEIPGMTDASVEKTAHEVLQRSEHKSKPSGFLRHFRMQRPMHS